MKHMRSAAKASAAAKMKAMGGSCGGRSHKYATGGVVRPTRAYAAGGSVMEDIDGAMPQPRMDRPSRSGKSKGGTNVNVIVMPKGGDGPAPMPPMMPPPPAAAAPMPLPPPKPPMMPPQGNPDMPMHKHGGRVAAFKRGGKVKRAEGGLVDKLSTAASYLTPAFPVASAVRAAQAYTRDKFADDAAKSAGNALGVAKEKSAVEAEGRKSGGKVKRAEGGRIHMDAGAGSGEGRLEKIKDAKKAKR